MYRLAILGLWVALSVAAKEPAPANEPERVARARLRVQAPLAETFGTAGVTYPPAALLLRVFKEEGVLEVWAAGARGAAMIKVREYAICARSGGPGPKRAEGDLQVPEGFYVIDRFNPWSAFHLSLGINYPNASDRLRSKERPGGDIFIHGGCATIGCVPIEDAAIEELYILTTDARSAGAPSIPVHLFPKKLDAAGLAEAVRAHPDQQSFWRELAEGYGAFERTRRIPRVTVDPTTGAYRINAR